MLDSGQRAQVEVLVDRAAVGLASPPKSMEVDWASTEASPSGQGSGGLQMKDYLRWHFDYGANAMVFNVRATSDDLSQRLESAVRGDAALPAYRGFLNPTGPPP